MGGSSFAIRGASPNTALASVNSASTSPRGIWYCLEAVNSGLGRTRFRLCSKPAKTFLLQLRCCGRPSSRQNDQSTPSIKRRSSNESKGKGETKEDHGNALPQNPSETCNGLNINSDYIKSEIKKNRKRFCGLHAHKRFHNTSRSHEKILELNKTPPKDLSSEDSPYNTKTAKLRKHPRSDASDSDKKNPALARHRSIIGLMNDLKSSIPTKQRAQIKRELESYTQRIKSNDESSSGYLPAQFENRISALRENIEEYSRQTLGLCGHRIKKNQGIRRTAHHIAPRHN